MTDLDALSARGGWAALVDGFLGGYVGPPSVAGPRFVYERRPLAGAQTELTISEGGHTEVLELGLDPRARRVPGIWKLSPGGTSIAAAAHDRQTGRGRLWVTGLTGGELIDASPEDGACGGLAWLSEGELLHLARPGDDDRWHLRHHRLGSPWSEDHVLRPGPGRSSRHHRGGGRALGGRDRAGRGGRRSHLGPSRAQGWRLACRSPGRVTRLRGRARRPRRPDLPDPPPRRSR